MWVEKKEISCGGLMPLKLMLVEDFIKICNLKLGIKRIKHHGEGYTFAATP